MTRARRARGLARVLAATACAALGSAGCAVAKRPAAAPVAAAHDDTRRLEGRPAVVVIARDGDPRGAVALALTTQGIAPERGAEPAAAIAAVIEARLAPALGASVMPSGDGVRVRALAASDAEGAAVADAMRAALLAPIGDAEVAAARKKLAALARRPLADAALEPASRCASELVAPPGSRGDTATPIDRAALESWRDQAARVGRVAIATAGPSSLGDAVVAALARGPAWPAAAAIAADAPMPTDARVYDATGEAPANEGRAARATLAVRVATAEQAVRAAEALGDPQGALAARLGGLDAPARVRDVTATAHAKGGCLVVALDFAPRDLGDATSAQRGELAAARIATAVALAKQEIATELGARTPRADDDARAARAIARRAGDPRDAADAAAWWTLSARDESVASDAEPRVAVAVGIALGRDAAPSESPLAARATAIRGEIDRAVVAWHEPVVEARARVEAGQGELWIALGSPCGTLPEQTSDAGLGAAFAIAAADRTELALHGSGAVAEAWAAGDGLGVVVHGPALPGESPEEHARRLADALARSFAAEPLDRGAIARARARLLDADDANDARALVTLADAVAPGHPSWLAPMGPAEALGRSSDAAVSARASAVRAGPLRVAVIAPASDAQAQAAVRAIDRWVARRPGAARACPVPSAPPAPKAATYAVETSAGGPSQAWLALPIAASDPGARASAEWIAAALDGGDGLLAHALSGGLARSWGARVVAAGPAGALVVRVDSAAGALDAAVAQVRALLDRLRRGALTDADRARAASLLGERDLAATLDPARRVASLWRGPSSPTSTSPTLDTLRAFASSTLRDDALVIVAVRPPRPAKPS